MNYESNTSNYTKFRSSKLLVTWQARYLLYEQLYARFWEKKVVHYLMQ